MCDCVNNLLFTFVVLSNSLDRVPSRFVPVVCGLGARVCFQFLNLLEGLHTFFDHLRSAANDNC